MNATRKVRLTGEKATQYLKRIEEFNRSKGKVYQGKLYQVHPAFYPSFKNWGGLKLEVLFSSSAPNVNDNFPLPQELMVKIFKIMLKDQPPREQIHILSQLAEVCERWRQIILQEITLWDDFELVEWAEKNYEKFKSDGYLTDRFTYAKGRVINLDSKVKKLLYKAGRINYSEKPIHPCGIEDPEYFSLALSKKRITIVRPKIPQEALDWEYIDYNPMNDWDSALKCF